MLLVSHYRTVIVALLLVLLPLIITDENIRKSNNDINNNVGSGGSGSSIESIPKIVHFVYGLKPDPVSAFEHYMAVLSASKHIKPDKIFFHYYYRPTGENWEKIRPLVTPKKLLELPEYIFGNPVTHYAHKADIVRLEILMEYGGIYLDMDVISLKSFDDLLTGEHDMIMGQEGENASVGLCNAVIISKPKSSFLKRWYESYRTFNQKDWNYHSVILPAKLANIYPKEIQILSHNSFFWPTWETSGLREIYVKSTYDYSPNYAIHIWETAARPTFLNNLTLSTIQNSDNLLFCLIRGLINPDQAKVDPACNPSRALIERSDKLIALWDFKEENGDRLIDASGNSLHGVMNPLNGFSLGKALRRKENIIQDKFIHYLSFDGDKDNAFLPTPANLRFESLSLSFWIRFPKAKSLPAWKDVVTLEGTTATLVFELHYSAGDRLELVIYDLTLNNPAVENWIKILPDVNFLDGDWHQFGISIDGITEALYLYADGTLVASSSWYSRTALLHGIWLGTRGMVGFSHKDWSSHSSACDISMVLLFNTVLYENSMKELSKRTSLHAYETFLFEALTGILNELSLSSVPLIKNTTIATASLTTKTFDFANVATHSEKSNAIKWNTTFLDILMDKDVIYLEFNNEKRSFLSFKYFVIDWIGSISFQTLPEIDAFVEIYKTVFFTGHEILFGFVRKAAKQLVPAMKIVSFASSIIVETSIFSPCVMYPEKFRHHTISIDGDAGYVNWKCEHIQALATSFTFPVFIKKFMITNDKQNSGLTLTLRTFSVANHHQDERKNLFRLDRSLFRIFPEGNECNFEQSEENLENVNSSKVKLCIRKSEKLENEPLYVIQNRDIVSMIKFHKEMKNNQRLLSFVCDNVGETDIILIFPGQGEIYLHKTCRAEELEAASSESSSLDSSISMKMQSETKEQQQIAMAFKSNNSIFSNSSEISVLYFIVIFCGIFYVIKDVFFKRVNYRKVTFLLLLSLLILFTFMFLMPNVTDFRLSSNRKALSQHINAFPLISVLVPCYNQAHFVKAAMYSIVYQNYRNWEMIVVDDGSPDNCQAVAADVKRLHPDKNIKVVKKVNGGLSSARNFASRISRGTWICALDADDYLHVRYFEKTMQALVQNPNADLILSNQQFFGDSSWKWEVPAYSHSLLLQKGIFPVQTLYKKADLRSIGGYTEILPWGNEDWNLWISLSSLRKMNVVKIPEYLNMYRYKTVSMQRGMEKFKEVPSLMRTIHFNQYDIDSLLSDHEFIFKNGHIETSQYLVKKSKVSLSNRKEEYILYMWLGIFAEKFSGIENAIKLYSKSVSLLGSNDWQPAFRLACALQSVDFNSSLDLSMTLMETYPFIKKRHFNRCKLEILPSA